MISVVFALLVIYEKVDFGKKMPPKVPDAGWCCDILVARGI